MIVLAALFFRPPLGWSITVLLLLSVVAAVLWFAWYRGQFRWRILLRLLGVAALGWVLLGPSQMQEQTQNDQALPRLVLLVDTSASMAQRDVSLEGHREQVTRLEALRASWLSQETLLALRRVAQVEVVGFAAQVRPMDAAQLEPVGKATHLYDAVDAYRDAVVVVMSDGHDTRAASGAMPTLGDTHRASAVGFAVPVGASQGAPDAAIQAWAHSDRLFEGQSTQIEAHVYQRGFADRSARVELLLEGAVVQTREIVLSSPLQQVVFEVQPTLAPRQPAQVHGYACRVTVLGDEEAYIANNVEDVFLQVTREKVRVLVLEGDPYWDTRSLARLLGTHPSFDVTAIYALGNRRQVTVRGETDHDETPTAPEALAHFDVVVLGRRIERLIDARWPEALVSFVHNGGAVVFARGQPILPSSPANESMLETVESISPARFGLREVADLKLAVSEAARGNPLTQWGDDIVIGRMPGMIAATRMAGRQQASVVLLEQVDGETTSAAITTLRVGRGVSMAVLSDGLWRWELLPSSLSEYSSVYAMFWTRAMQWLASGGEFLPGQDMSLELDRLSVALGETIAAQVAMRYSELEEIKPELRLIAPDGSETRITPGTPGVPGTLGTAGSGGRLTTQLSPSALGVYRVELTVPGRPDLVDPAFPLIARFAVVDRSIEQRDTTARPEVLKTLAEARGGRCLGLGEYQPVIDHLHDLHATRLADAVPVYRYAAWPAFALICGGLGLEWILRRRGGLL